VEFWAALAGALVGGGFALAGAWMQGRQQRKLAEDRRRDEQRRGWFQDLRRVYEQIGRHYAGVTAAFEEHLRTRQEAVRIPDMAENIHAQMLLHMHGASNEVLAASDGFRAIDLETLELAPGQATTEHFDRMVAALGDFYEACGSHFDEVWPTGDEDAMETE
jgi:hypothetical protein